MSSIQSQFSPMAVPLICTLSQVGREIAERRARQAKKKKKEIIDRIKYIWQTLFLF